MSMYGNGTDPQDMDAFAGIKKLLDSYGLGDLGDWAWDLMLQGASDARVQVELYDQPAFKERFPVIAQRKAAGLPPVSPTDVLNYENSWSQMAIASGLPASFRNRDVAQLAMGKNISLAEMQSRVNDGYKAVANADPAVRQAFSHYFGHDGDNALASMFIDPTRALPDLERMVTEAQIGGAATRNNFTLDEHLANDAARAGITGQQAGAQFGQLAENRSLFEETIGERGGTDLKIEEQGARAALGLDAADAAAVKRRSQERQAAYGGGDSAITGVGGATGLGSARPV